MKHKRNRIDARSGRKKNNINGQGTPADTATAFMWRDSKNFSEVFNRTIYRSDFVSPDELEDASTAEETVLDVREGVKITVKQIRDVSKLYRNGTIYMIMGIENQSRVNYEMPFRAMTYDFIN